MPPKFSLLQPIDYIKDATDCIRQAKRHISLITLVIGSDNSTKTIIEALIEAANRGVKVEVAADIYTYLEHSGMILPTIFKTKSSKSTNLMSKNLIKNGVKFNWLGQYHPMLISGRTHIKWCIVDDIVYSFGGVNLYDDGISGNDYMIKVADKKLADNLVDEFKRILVADAKSYNYKSHSFMNGDDEILIDGGIIGDSIIYRRACQLATRANTVTFVSQYCPTGKLSRLLNHTNSSLYFNPPKSTNGLTRLLITVSMLITGNSSLYHKKQYLHAKLMIFEMKDGQKIALTGSHNFVDAGVLLGTREITLQTKNPLIIKQLEDFVAKHVA